MRGKRTRVHREQLLGWEAPLVVQKNKNPCPDGQHPRAAEWRREDESA